MRNTLPGDPIWHTSETHTVTLIWKWILMVWEVSVSWQRQKFSDLEYISRHSVSRSMQRLKDLERLEFPISDVLSLLS